ncbi:MAG: FMN-binding glutamate synthase family protein [Gammaproteobacteria bacterium]|jgi:glutamate synthase domain-containing protein 2
MAIKVYSWLAAVTLVAAVLTWIWVPAGWLFVLILPAWAVALFDSLQRQHSLRRNFPLIGRARWIAEYLRPFVRQYFIESDTSGAPISRMFRSIVYQRAKRDDDTNPYGTRLDVYRDGYEWLGHSLRAVNVDDIDTQPRVTIGGEACRQKYSASILNISAMSFGSLSSAAVTALNRGAKHGKFYHNTGEGGISPYHLQGGDLVWQVGTGYFGCRTKKGRFDPELFTENAARESVRMIELKLSQGAKPGHGGILPAEKNSVEIARIRIVEPHTRVKSPSVHPEFDTPVGLLEFLQKLRELSDGKPVGFKLCVGRPHEFVAICMAMVETGILPDFITVDGSEGGTGAAPLEYSNSVGMPLREGLAFVDDCLTGFGVRDEVRVIASGKILTGFHLVKHLALGADLCNSARGMMLALGCVQSLVCHTNRCPTGVATQNPRLAAGLVVEDKYQRVYRFHDETMHAMVDLISSSGLAHTSELARYHIHRRVNQHEVLRYDELYPPAEPGSFLRPPYPENYARFLEEATVDSFGLR